MTQMGNKSLISTVYPDKFRGMDSMRELKSSRIIYEVKTLRFSATQRFISPKYLMWYFIIDEVRIVLFIFNRGDSEERRGENLNF
jgi:hypothetical protein